MKTLKKTNSFQNHSNAETQNRQAKIKNTLKNSKIVMFGGDRRTKSYESIETRRCASLNIHLCKYVNINESYSDLA